MLPLGETSSVAVGADLGGSKLAVGLVDADGRVLRHNVVPILASRGVPAVLEELAVLVRELCDEADAQHLHVRGVGVATAGLVCPVDGAVVATTESLPGFGGFHLKEQLGGLLAADVTVVNDVQAMALGEALFGAARGAGDALCVAVGTGIGGALTSGGKVSSGHHGFAGDVGHVLVDVSPSARRCPCGRVGHLEAYASGPALSSAYELRAGALGLAGNLRPVVERAKCGDELAREVLAEGARLLGRAVGGLVNLLDPELVVFGGGLVQLSEDLFWGPVAEHLRQEVRAPYAPRVERAYLGTKAALVGAAAKALGHLDELGEEGHAHTTSAVAKARPKRAPVVKNSASGREAKST
jgi:glucokinase